MITLTPIPTPQQHFKALYSAFRCFDNSTTKDPDTYEQFTNDYINAIRDAQLSIAPTTKKCIIRYLLTHRHIIATTKRKETSL